MDFNSAIKLLGKLAICLLALFVAFVSSNASISAGGVFAFAGVLNGLCWAAALVWGFKRFILPKTDADKYKES